MHRNMDIQVLKRCTQCEVRQGVGSMPDTSTQTHTYVPQDLKMQMCHACDWFLLNAPQLETSSCWCTPQATCRDKVSSGICLFGSKGTIPGILDKNATQLDTSSCWYTHQLHAGGTRSPRAWFFGYRGSTPPGKLQVFERDEHNPLVSDAGHEIQTQRWQWEGRAKKNGIGIWCTWHVQVDTTFEALQATSNMCGQLTMGITVEMRRGIPLSALYALSHNHPTVLGSKSRGKKFRRNHTETPISTSIVGDSFLAHCNEGLADQMGNRKRSLNKLKEFVRHCFRGMHCAEMHARQNKPFMMISSRECAARKRKAIFDF